MRLSWTANGCVYIGLGIPKDRPLAEMWKRLSPAASPCAFTALLVFALPCDRRRAFGAAATARTADAAGRFACGALAPAPACRLPATRSAGWSRPSTPWPRHCKNARRAGTHTHARAGSHACQPRALATLSAGNMALVRATDEPALWHEMCRAAVEVGGNPVAWAGYAESPAGHHRYASGVGAGREIQAGLPTVGDPRGGGHPERQACRRARPGQQRERYPALRPDWRMSCPLGSAWRCPSTSTASAVPCFLGVAQPHTLGKERDAG